MKNILPFEKLYRNRIVWLVSVSGDLILHGAVDWREPASRSFAVKCVDRGIKIVTRSPLNSSSGMPLFYSLYYPCSTKRAALRLSAILRHKFYSTIKYTLSDSFKFKQDMLQDRGLRYVVDIDSLPSPARKVDGLVTIESRNTFKHATETHISISKGRDVSLLDNSLSLACKEIFGGGLSINSGEAPTKPLQHENFWVTDGDQE